MNYFSLDLETPGLSPKGELLQLALVAEDTARDVPVDQLPHFVGYVVRDSYDHVEPYAAAMHAGLWRQIDEFRKVFHAHPLPGVRVIYPFDDNGVPRQPTEAVCIARTASDVCAAAVNWVQSQVLDWGLPWRSRVTVAGKNVAAFDYQFITDELKACFRHRVLDPGSVFADFGRTELPSLDELLERLGLGRSVQHDALEDARDVIRVLRCAPGYSRRPSPVDAMHDAIDAARRGAV